MENYSKIFADNLRKYRKLHGLTQGQLASKLGYTEKAVSKWELGGSIPPVETLILLAETFSVSLDDLFDVCTEPSYYLGVDGGATKTTFALADADGNIISKLVLGPSNCFDLGFDAAAQIIGEGINKITANIRKKKISFFAGLSGGGAPDFKEKFRSFFEGFGFLRFDNGSDAENIIAAGLRGENGAIVIMGTGSSCFVSVDGVSRRIGGLGYLFDHGGSGYDLGNAAIRAALSFEDGSGEETAIYELMKEATGFSSLLDNLSHFYKIGKSGVASFSPIVFKAYDMGDRLAREILDDNMRHVANLIATTKKYLPETDEKIKVAIVGGLTKRWDVLYPMLDRHLSSMAVREDFAPEVYDGDIVCGALLRAGAPIK